MDRTSILFKSFAEFGRASRIPLNDPNVMEAFKAHVASEVEEAVASDGRLHGHRTQNMFEALIVSLNQFKILKVEDEGRLYARENSKLPDFMLVLEGGHRWVVEVKNVYDNDVYRQRTKFRCDYIEGNLEDCCRLGP